MFDKKLILMVPKFWMFAPWNRDLTYDMVSSWWSSLIFTATLFTWSGGCRFVGGRVWRGGETLTGCWGVAALWWSWAAGVWGVAALWWCWLKWFWFFGRRGFQGWLKFTGIGACATCFCWLSEWQGAFRCFLLQDVTYIFLLLQTCSRVAQEGPYIFVTLELRDHSNWNTILHQLAACCSSDRVISIFSVNPRMLCQEFRDFGDPVVSHILRAVPWFFYCPSCGGGW